MKKFLITLTLPFLLATTFAQTTETQKPNYIYATHSADIPWWDENFNSDYKGEKYENDILKTEICPMGASDTVYFTDFTFDIPLEHQIDNVKINFYKKDDRDRPTKDTLFSIWNGELIGQNLSKSETWTSDSIIYEYGEEVQDWNEILTPEMINSSDFGVAVQAATYGYCTGIEMGNMEITITHSYPVVSSINVKENKKDFKVFPNPSNGQFNMTTKNKVIEAVKITSLNGTEVINLTPNADNFTLNSQLQKGFYILKAKIDGQWQSDKLTIE